MFNSLFIASEFGTGQVFWSFIWFFLFFIWIWLFITIFADIIRAKDMSGWAKALWSIFIIFLPYLGVFVYLIANGGKMQDRMVQQVQAQQEASNAYIREVAGSGSSISDELKNLADMHTAGTITDDEYEKAKAKIIG